MPSSILWPHAPSHFLDSSGTYIFTAATYKRAHLFNRPENLNVLMNLLFRVAETHAVSLQAWSLFSNHYHFVAQVSDASRLSSFVRELHSRSAHTLNDTDNTPARKVWFQYWETHITYERSYFARLHYVHRNPVHHGLVRAATLYPWCSAAWFESEAPTAFRKTVFSVACDRIRIEDDFRVVPPRADSGHDRKSAAGLRP
jgi:putative transposase